MLQVLLVLTLLNTIALSYLIGMVTQIVKANAQKQTPLPPSASPALLLDVSAAADTTPAQTLLSPADANVLEADDLAKIDVQVKAGNLPSWYTFTIYNGTTWHLEELVVNLVASSEGREITARLYKIDGFKMSEAKPLANFIVENFTAFELEKGQTVKASVVSGRRKPETK